MPSGGYRPGSGRKVSGTVTKSKVVRVTPLVESYLDSLEPLLELIEDWESQAAAVAPDSRGWVQARKLIQELRELFPEK